MASEWAKANKVGNQQGGACELRDGWENTFSLFWVGPRTSPRPAPPPHVCTRLPFQGAVGLERKT